MHNSFGRYKDELLSITNPQVNKTMHGNPRVKFRLLRKIDGIF